ncbi:MAG TPA: squalene/phytoene synthase family protein, partial [Solirubrobacteraceae bacterium]
VALSSSVIGTSAFMAGVRRLGASRASIVSSAEPALTAAFAFAAFGDRFGTVQLAGAGLVLASVPILEVKRTRSNSHRRASGPGARGSHHSLRDHHIEKEPPMTTPNVIRQPAGDSTPSQPIRRLWQRAPVDIDAAYDVCEQITQVHGRDRYSAVDSLPAYRRQALCAIYAFARRVDDTAHGNLRHAEKLRLLADARADIPRDGTPRPTDPVLVALRDVNRRFPISLASLDDLIDGAESDVHGATYDTFEELVQHCRQVAGSIWRLSVAVLGSRDPAATAQLADDLGVAIHLTNILRDLVRDLERGRVYIPRGDLELFGCPADPLSTTPELLGRLIRHQTRRNRDWYDRGLALLPLLDARGAACVEAVASMPHADSRAHRSLTDRCPARTDLPARTRESPDRGDRAHSQAAQSNTA